MCVPARDRAAGIVSLRSDTIVLRRCLELQEEAKKGLYHRQVRVAGLHATGARCVRAFTKQGGWRNRCEELILRRCLEPQQADFGRQDAYPGRPRPE